MQYLDVKINAGERGALPLRSVQEPFPCGGEGSAQGEKAGTEVGVGEAEEFSLRRIAVPAFGPSVIWSIGAGAVSPSSRSAPGTWGPR